MLHNVSFVDVLDFNKTQVFLEENDIIHIKIKPEQVIEVNDFKEIIKRIIELGLVKPRLILFEAGYHASVSPEVRDFAAHPNANYLSLGDAIVIHTLAQRLMANFYVNFNKPSRPTKVFDNVDEAFTWLYQLKEDLA